MARGYPLVWSPLLGAPFGILGFVLQQGVLTATVVDAGIAPWVAESLGVTLLVYGGFVGVLGGLVQVIPVFEPALKPDEAVVARRYPTQKVARAKLGLGGLLFGLFGYLLFGTLVPFIYPILALFVGMVVFSSGLYQYWMNCLTTYVITTERVIVAYRFVSLLVKEVPLVKVRGIEERRSAWESLVGIGSLRVASGGGGRTLALDIRSINDASAFANTLRSLL